MGASRKMLKTIGGFTGFLLVIAIAAVVNFAIRNVSVRVDMTQEKLYTLSKGTVDILGKLQHPVTLKLFFNRSSREVPMEVKYYADQVEDLLREYESAGKGRIIVEKHDPKPDSDAEDWARRYGVAGQQLGMNGPRLYLGLVAESGDTHEVLPVVDPSNEDVLEYNFSRMISKVANPRKAIVGVMSSLQVLGTPARPYAMPGQPTPEKKDPWIGFGEMRQLYDVRQVEMTAEEIDPDMDVLIVVHPKGIEDRTVYAIDQFVLRGGSLVAFVDPLSIAELEINKDGNPYGIADTSSTLDKLFKAWGVGFNVNEVAVDPSSATMLGGPNGVQEENPAWLSLRAQNMNKNEVLAAQLDTLMLPYAGSFSASNTANMTVTSLLQTSLDSAPVMTVAARMGAQSLRQDFVSAMKKLDLAVRLEGKFKTAFPAGQPAKPDKDGDDDKDGTPNSDAKPGLTESSKSGVVVLVGDSDMLFDRFCVQAANFFGFTTFQPMNNNLDFLANLTDQMGGGTDLISIRSRGRIDRPFEVVQELQNKAQSKWMEQEKLLQQKLETAQQRLNELQTRKDESQRFILSPEQKKEIDQFKLEESEARKELKLVRRSLREGIERLGVRIKLINILLAPVLLTIAGIGFWLFRRSRAGK